MSYFPVPETNARSMVKQRPGFIYKKNKNPLLLYNQSDRKRARSPAVLILRHYYSRTHAPRETTATFNHWFVLSADDDSSSSLTTASSMHRSVSEKRGSCGGVGGPSSSSSSSSRNRGPGLRRPSAPHMHSTPNVYHGRRRESGGSACDGSPTDVPGATSTFGCTGMSRVNTLSEGELLDVAILPIFQKLLTERRAHASSSHHHHHHHHHHQHHPNHQQPQQPQQQQQHQHHHHHNNRASIASCPNIAVKCDIVEYL